MQITRQADYAVRAVLYLAGLGPSQHTSTAQIAREQKIPATFLAKIVSQLSAVGILRATRGAHGGVTLARPANAIALLEVVEAMDGPILLNECVLDPALCPLGHTCAIQSIWCETQAELVKRLSRATFHHLVSQSELPTVPPAR